jgi:chorismate mutase
MAMNQLKVLRDKIDQLDESLIHTLAMRFEITSEIGKLKKAERLPPIDAQREQQQAEKISAIAKKVGLRESVALAVLRVIIDAVVEDHQKV